MRPSGPLSFSSFGYLGDDECRLKRESARTERSRGGRAYKVYTLPCTGVSHGITATVTDDCTGAVERTANASVEGDVRRLHVSWSRTANRNPGKSLPLSLRQRNTCALCWPWRPVRVRILQDKDERLMATNGHLFEYGHLSFTWYCWQL